MFKNGPYLELSWEPLCIYIRVYAHDSTTKGTLRVRVYYYYYSLRIRASGGGEGQKPFQLLPFLIYVLVVIRTAATR